MEEIIGLLIALAAVILKAVGSRLEKSGRKPSAPVSSEDVPEAGGLDVKGWILEALEEAAGEPADPEVLFDDDGQIVEVKPVVVQPEPVRPAAKRKILQEDETSGKKGEKIDPKKLVIYSEIMKPKF
jgi:hypothetical protein